MSGTSNEELSERIVDLEVRLAYQDRVVATLDEVVRTFTSRVEELERAVVALRSSVESPPATLAPSNDPPPHY